MLGFSLGTADMLGTEEGSWDGLVLGVAEVEGSHDGILLGASELILGLPLGLTLRLGVALPNLVG